MAYAAPYIDETGLHFSSYRDILNDMISQVKAIYGTDIYLEEDSQDYQFISVFASKAYDVLQAIQYAYNSRSPSTAIGVALESLVKLNGLAKNSATYSKCNITLTGIAGTSIANGVVQDINGYTWNLPGMVTIGSGGTTNAQVTCSEAGAISANAGEISIIVTPTYGWTSVTNAGAATVGNAIETDSELRSRQAYSTAQPSLTVLEATKGAIADIDAVTRFIVYENDTSATDADGLPAHSITAVVEGGEEKDIAKAIFNNKGPGGYTHGDQEVIVTDEYYQETTIRFYRPTYMDIDVTVNVKSLAGYTSATTAEIKAELVNYLNSLEIGADLATSSLWGAALSAMENLAKPTFSITSLTACVHGGTPGTADIEIDFNEITRGNASYITVNVT